MIPMSGLEQHDNPFKSFPEAAFRGLNEAGDRARDSQRRESSDRHAGCDDTILRERLGSHGSNGLQNVRRLDSLGPSSFSTSVVDCATANGRQTIRSQVSDDGAPESTQMFKEVGLGSQRSNGAPQDPDPHVGHPQRHTEGVQRARKLSSAKIYEFTRSPEALPRDNSNDGGKDLARRISNCTRESSVHELRLNDGFGTIQHRSASGRRHRHHPRDLNDSVAQVNAEGEVEDHEPSISKKHTRLVRPEAASRTVSTPTLQRRTSSQRLRLTQSPIHRSSKTTLSNLASSKSSSRVQRSRMDHKAAATPSTVPAPPTSLSTYLDLELSSQPPPPFYIQRSKVDDNQYESSRVKLERLQNFLWLTPRLEQVLWFGALACLDAWLYAFTLLPLRFLKALSMLIHSWCRNALREIRYIGQFIYLGSGRMWRRRRTTSNTSQTTASVPSSPKIVHQHEADPKTASFSSANSSTGLERSSAPRGRRSSSTVRHHRRTKSIPSSLEANHKADILKGLLILTSCIILMYFDASRMYHGIRGQAAIKLYVIYNVLEVRSQWSGLLKMLIDISSRCVIDYFLPLAKMFWNVFFQKRL